MPRPLSLLRAVLLLFATACAHPFVPASFQSNESLYQASLAEFHRGHWENAVAGFDKLTIDLPARDTLLPRSYYWLGRAHAKAGDYLLAAQSYSRLTESFPDDSQADVALMEAGHSYEQMWRRPQLDAEYGASALNTYRTLLSMYPNSKYRDRATQRVQHLDEMFAAKDFENGMHYFRRKAFDSAIIYFKDVAKNYPQTAHSRLAQLRLVDAYRAIRYREDATDVCATLQKSFPDDREVRVSCAGMLVPAPTAATTRTP